MKLTKLTATLLGSAALAMSSAAAITGTFVAAQDGVNSFQSSLLGNGNPGGAFSNTTVTAGLWNDRSGGTFNIASISPSGGYQGQASTSNEIVTTLALTPGQQYDIYVIYGVANSGGASGGLHAIDAGFASGALATFTENTSLNTGELLGAAAWSAYEEVIGTATADASTGEIDVYVNYATGAERSVYNGLSYVQVPEPASVALLAACRT